MIIVCTVLSQATVFLGVIGTKHSFIPAKQDKTIYPTVIFSLLFQYLTPGVILLDIKTKSAFFQFSFLKNFSEERFATLSLSPLVIALQESGVRAKLKPKIRALKDKSRSKITLTCRHAILLRFGQSASRESVINGA